MLVKVYGASVRGLSAIPVTIEVNASRGIKFFLVGLPDNAVKESHERIVAAVENSGYRFPSKQFVVNMAPADIRKEGAGYDLPLAVGILATDEKVKPDHWTRKILLFFSSRRRHTRSSTVSWARCWPNAFRRTVQTSDFQKNRPKGCEAPPKAPHGSATIVPLRSMPSCS